VTAIATPKDDDPGGDVLDRGELDHCDDEEDRQEQWIPV
jgi:hypothetical protein